MNANPYRCLVPALVGICSRSVMTAWVDVRSSSRISTSTRNTRPTSGHPHSTRKSPADPARESVQIARLRSLATESGLDPDFAEKFLNFMVREVIRHHEDIKAAYDQAEGVPESH